MVRFGSSEKYHPDIKNNTLAKLFLNIFGNVDTGSSHHHFIKTFKKLPFSRISNVLDVGCGKGKNSFWLSQMYTNLSIDAFDISEKNITHCKEIQTHLNTNCNFFVDDVLNFEKSSHYDLIFSNHVLEHVAENKRAIGNLVRSLRPGGFIYIQIPNATQTRLFPDKFFKSHNEWAEDEHIGQTLTLDSLCRTLRDLNCILLVEKHTSGFWGKLSFEIKEISVNYLNSKALFAVLYPALKLFGYLDTFPKYKNGNGILVLAQKRTNNS